MQYNKSYATASKILTAVLIIISANNPVKTIFWLLGGGGAWVAVWLIIVVLFMIHFKKGFKFSKELSIYFIGMAILLIIQTYLVDTLPAGTYIVQFSMPLLTFLVLLFCGEKFLNDAPKIMAFLIKLSLVFWIPTILLSLKGINILDYLPKYLLLPDNDVDFKTHLIIHNFRSSYWDFGAFIRNCGMFWEPGAFAGMINFCYLLIFVKKDLFTKKEKRHLEFWFIIGILTAQSTTGLIVFAVLFFSNKLIEKGNAFAFFTRILLFLPVFLLISYALYTNLPMLNQKIDDQFQQVSEKQVGWEATRLGTLFLTSNIILDNPWLGIGFANENMKNQLSQYGYKTTASPGNGMFLYVMQSGIPFFIFIIILWYNGIYKISQSRLRAILGLIAILLMLQGEAWMTYPFIYVFIFLPIINKDNANNLNSYSYSQPAANYAGGAEITL